MKTLTTAFLALCSTFGLAQDGPSTLIIGETKLMGNGTLRSWAEVTADKKPVKIGVTFNDLAMLNLPKVPYNGTPTSYEVAIVPGVKDVPFTEVSVDFMTEGHEPQPIYGVPHFDIHFYLVPRAERMTWAINNDADKKVFSKPVPAEFMAPDYILAPGTEIPFMGAHWVDVNTPELHQQAFTATLIYGSHDGKVVFWEPMIAKSFLDTKPNIDRTMKLPNKVTKSGYYPKAWSVHYDEDRHEYTVALSDFVYMKASS